MSLTRLRSRKISAGRGGTDRRTANGGRSVKKYGVNELREMFLSFFEEKGCLRLGSFSLVPHNDKSLLIIDSGRRDAG